jgi:hypothetical protein
MHKKLTKVMRQREIIIIYLENEKCEFGRLFQSVVK